MLGHPGVALRMLAAHLIVGAPNIRAEPDRQQTRKEATAESLAASKGEAVFAKERQEITALFELDDAASISGGNGDEYRLANIFARLMKLSDEDVTRILGIIAGELLAPGHAAIDCIERVIPFEIAEWMTPDDAFFDLSSRQENHERHAERDRRVRDRGGECGRACKGPEGDHSGFS